MKILNFYRGYLIISSTRLWKKKSLLDLELTLSWWFSIYFSYDPINKVIKLVEAMAGEIFGEVKKKY